MYNAYIPNKPPHEKIPEGPPPGFESSCSAPTASLKGLWDRLGLGKLDTGDLLLPYQHTLANKDPAVNPAHVGKLQIAIVRNGVDHETHLIHVGRQHKLFRTRDGSLLFHDEVPHGIHPNAVGIGGYLRPDMIPYSILMAGHTRQSAEFF